MKGAAIFHALSTITLDKPLRAAQSAVGLRSKCPSAPNKCVLQVYCAFAKPSEGLFKSSTQELLLTEMEKVKTMDVFFLTWLT